VSGDNMHFALIDRSWRVGQDMELRFATVLLLLLGLCQPCLARQDVFSVLAQVEDSPHPSPDAPPAGRFP